MDYFSGIQHNYATMAAYNFEGDINGLNDCQLEFINSVIIKQGFKVNKVTFEQVGKAGDNYASNVKRITVEGENETLTIIVKVAPSNEFHRLSMNSPILFKNEHIMYTEFLPKLLELQKEANVLEEDHLKFAKCYGSMVEEPNEIIILEDLSTLDFVMLDRFESLSDECIKSILKNFAILHSFSYVLKNKEPERYEYFKTNLRDMWRAVAKNEHVKSIFLQIEAVALTVLGYPKYQDVLRNKIVDFVTFELSQPEDSNKYSVIQQGDSWTNNIMFRFEEGELKESIMIDYQLSKSTSPVCDLLYMIFNCTDHETRSKHYYDWLDYYHAELDKSLSNFGLKAISEYPREQLDADMKKYGKSLFALCVILGNTLTLNSEDAAKMMEGMKSGDIVEMTENLNSSSFNSESGTRFRNRLIGLIDSFKEFDLL